jgi:hypothetical protein
MNKINSDHGGSRSDQLLLACVLEYEEYLEMYRGQEWEFVARSMVHKLVKSLDETEYYKRLCDANVSRNR